jgi:uncharacterized protein YqgV (UPF0045/DUF77 family)
MRLPLILAATLVAAAPLASAQTPAPASSPAKKELVLRILAVQQPAIENMARQLVEVPAARLMQQAGPVLQQKIAADKREAVAQEIQADVKKYVDEAVPFVRDRAVKLGPTTIGTMLEEKFTEDELKQIIATLESPVYKRFNAMGNDMQRALGEKLVGETRSTMEPKMQALQQAVGRRLGVAPAPAAAASGAKKK